ncbi:MAG: alpha/beta fold hydrolase [Halioglobus sp.]
MMHPVRALHCFLHILLFSLAAASVSTATELDDVDHQTIIIQSQGVRLAGDLYKPKGLKADEKRPGILLVPGWGGSKENLKKNYAADFAAQGFIVLAFDYKSWGQSEGPLVPVERLAHTEEAAVVNLRATHIRKVVNPYSMMADIRASLNYLSGEPQVTSDNLGIWGTSFGGALSLVMASSDDRIKAYVDQMGPVNFGHNYKDLAIQMTRQMAVAMARGELPPFPDPEGRKNPGLKGYPDWSALKRFDPMAQLDGLQAPTLIIDAENEEFFDRSKNGQLLYETIKGRVDSRYIVYPGKHYDIYKGDNRKAASKEAIDWFVTYLKTDSGT